MEYTPSEEDNTKKLKHSRKSEKGAWWFTILVYLLITLAVFLFLYYFVVKSVVANGNLSQYVN
jgi:flagellar biogenesis protein FliO